MDDPPVPKYRAPDFMRKQIGLFYNARYQMRMLRRYGDDDAPIQPIAPIAGVRAVREVRRLGHGDSTI